MDIRKHGILLHFSRDRARESIELFDYTVN